MPKKQQPAATGDQPSDKVTIKLYRDVHRMLSHAALDEGVDLTDLIDSILRPVAKQRYAKLANKIREESDE